MAQLTSQVKRAIPGGDTTPVPQGSPAQTATGASEGDSAAEDSAVKESSCDETNASGLYIDVLEYVDIGCNGFVTNISLVITTYQNLFLKT